VNRGASATVLPGSTVGVLGSGQLGRMLALAARRMGYRVCCFSPDAPSPAGQVADREIVAAYDDADALVAFARDVSVVTFEFENVPSDAAERLAAHVPVRPSPRVLHVAQDRIREKTFLAEIGAPVSPFAVIGSLGELDDAVARLGLPCVLKTATSGYDGKGQVRLDEADQTADAWARVGRTQAVLETFVDFRLEVSMLAARGLDGARAVFDLVENVHRRHVLDLSVIPARVDARLRDEARAIVERIVDALDLVGVLCVEMFVTGDGRLLVNEIAPRPHNSGHYSIDACVTSQFEQQLRAVCGLPLGSTRLLSPAAMANLLGDLWIGGEPDWAGACAEPDVKLHLYGKAAARPGRKMGHLTALAPSADEAERLVLAARQRLARS
jgi:5-(carboxyamino)imidazole ribonucleotide synthase